MLDLQGAGRYVARETDTNLPQNASIFSNVQKQSFKRLYVDQEMTVLIVSSCSK